MDHMNPDKRIAKYLGAAFLVVAAGSALSAALSPWTGTATEILERLSENPGQARAGILIELLVTSVGIVVLASLLYRVFSKVNKMISVVALAMWIAEAATLAIGQIGALALIPLSRAYVEVGAPAGSHFQTLADFLVAFEQRGNEIHMVFFAAGALLWYYLFYQSRYVPRVLSIWGIGSMVVLSIGVVLALAVDYESYLPYALYMPLEPVIGVWLMVKGIAPQPPEEVSHDESDRLQRVRGT
jgi:hypothetical protein